MQASSFYSHPLKQSIPLHMIDEASFRDLYKKSTQKTQHHFLTQRFEGKAGEVALLFDDNLRLLEVYIGQGEHQEAHALALAISRLPAGFYHPAAKMTDESLRIWALHQYRFDEFKSSETPLKVLCLEENLRKEVISEVSAHFLIRDLINLPANLLGPAEISTVMEIMAKRFDARFKAIVGDELLSEGFRAIHAVGAAAHEAPRLIHLEWGNPKLPVVVLVGKGVSFDSGGLDIKPSGNMRLMKKDMGGAAHVIGLAQWIMENELPIHLHVLVPTVENAIGSRAYRPGDVIKMRNGVSVEIDNTDAEGRLILADAFSMIESMSPEIIIDFATLTGAARIAVGTEIAAMFTNDTSVAGELEKASISANDPIWRLPLYKGYESMLDSSIADMVNSTQSSYAGAITAALFLERFVPKNLPWVHFDMMAWNTSSKPGRPEGGEAMGYRALIHFLKSRYGK